MDAFIRWAGSKKQLLPFLSSFWKMSFNRYIEPFAGSACLFFSLEPRKAILGDLNSDLINMLRMVKQQPNLVVEALSRLPIGERAYYRIRDADHMLLTEVEQAAIFIYLNKFCFNGLYRTNKSGKFNVPYGDTKGSNTIDAQKIFNASHMLQRAQLVCSDFYPLLQLATKGDFVYMDPPYFVRGTRVFSEYQAQPFGVADLDRLAGELHRLDKKGVKFVVSYADCKEGRSFLKPWLATKVLTRRNIAGFASNRKVAKELVATNIH
jgi:DNA adenine methylase